MKKSVLVLLMLAVGFASCDKDNECEITLSTTDVDQEQLQKDIGYIDDFLNDNGITAIEHESGLRYVVHVQGEGERPGLCSTIMANYSGHVLNRTSIFEANDSITFELSGLILGWRIGFNEIESGTSATFYIPSGMAYGTSGNGVSIPGNANLVFDVDFIEIVR